MIIQKVIKGISGLSDTQAKEILEAGIKSNWLRHVVKTDMSEGQQFMNMRNLDLHVNGYDLPIPSAHPLATTGALTYGKVTPFISTTAGTYETDGGRYLFRDPFRTAIEFATDRFTGTGHIFYAYVFILGKKSIAYQQFAEEIRDMNLYTDHMPFHYEGEVTAKIIIPSVQIEKVEEYNGPAVLADWKAGRKAQPINTWYNKINYLKPEKISNIREILS